MKFKSLNKVFSILLQIIGWLIVDAILLPVLLYIPFIQEFVKDVAVSQVSKATGWDITVDKILLQFPLDLSVHDVAVIENNDTIIAAGNLTVGVKIAPLFSGEVVVNEISLDNAKYGMTSADSSMVMLADIGNLGIKDISLDLPENEIILNSARLQNCNVNLLLDNEKSQPTPPDTTTTEGWNIIIGKIEIENLAYEMSMMPVIDSLRATIGSAMLTDGTINTSTQKIKAGMLAVDKLDGAYFTPSAQYLTEHPTVPDSVIIDETASLPWEIRCDSVRLTNSSGLYAMRDAVPAAGLDMSFLQASGITLSIDDFYNCGTAITVPITRFTAEERSGLKITQGIGTFAMDSAGMDLSNFKIATILSEINIGGHIDNSFFENSPDGNISLNLSAKIGLDEVSRIMPSYSQLISMIPRHWPLEANVKVDGSAANVGIKQLSLNLPRYATLAVSGHVTSPMRPDDLGVDMNIAGDLKNINFIKPSILEAEQDSSINFPPLKLNGNMKMRGEKIAGDLTLALPTGDLALDASWLGNTTDYDISLIANSLPINAVLPYSGFKTLCAKAMVKGHGLDIYDPETAIDARISVDDLEYDGTRYHDMKVNASLHDSNFDLGIYSGTEACKLALKATGTIAEDLYIVTMSAGLENIDLMQLGMSETPSNGHAGINIDGNIDLKSGVYSGSAIIGDFAWTLDKDYYYTDEMAIAVSCDTTQVTGRIYSGDMTVTFDAPCNIDTLISRFSESGNIITAQIDKKVIDADTLRNVLPPFDLDIKIGKRNIAAQFIENSGMTFDDMAFCIKKDSTFRMTGNIDKAAVGGITIDTINMYATERNRRINYMIHAANRNFNRAPGDIASVNLLGLAVGNRMTFLLQQKNFKDSVGMQLGLDATMDTSNVVLKLFPENPIIGYKKWTVNKDNLVAFNYHNKHFDANLQLRHDSSLVSLTTQHDEKMLRTDSNSVQEEIVLDISNVEIGEWITFSPFAPPIKGQLGAKLKVKYNGDNIWGNGTFSLDNFSFDKKRVGDFTLKTLLELDPTTGGTKLMANLSVDEQRVMRLYGALNDSTSQSPYNLWLELDKFPLKTANPFMPPSMLSTYGYLNGKMSVTQIDEQLTLNGFLQCDSTYMSVPMFSTNINLPNTQIPVKSSVITFNDYRIKMLNENPLIINGTVDLTDLADAGIDMSINGRNVQFVNSKQTKKAELFGRGYANIDASMKGSMNNLSLDATVSILAGTNITYVMQTDVNTLASQQKNNAMVTFVQFNDSTTYVKTDSTETAMQSNMDLTARLNIQQGSKINVFLSSNGNDRAEIEGSGTLSFALNQLGDMSLTGKYTIDNGFVRYSPPLISQLLFNISSGSFIQFNGDMMNPVLNLNAVQTIKTNVTQSGQDSRLVDFLVSLSVTNTLENMNVNFDLSTTSDVTVQNELQSMSETQRSNQAMNLLLYNTYTGPSTSASSDLTGNPLYSFLQSKLNSWAASTIKGVDLSFGIDQYDQTVNGVTSSTMRYSYQVSKTLFNDRFKIVVGGNYSPDVTAEDEIAQNLFNDVSLEYMLTKNGSMYLRLFNHTGFESILEGEVTQTGIGFVFRRKLSSLRNIFRFKWPGRDDEEQDSSVTVPRQAILQEKDSINTDMK